LYAYNTKAIYFPVGQVWQQANSNMANPIETRSRATSLWREQKPIDKLKFYNRLHHVL